MNLQLLTITLLIRCTKKGYVPFPSKHDFILTVYYIHPCTHWYSPPYFTLPSILILCHLFDANRHQYPEICEPWVSVTMQSTLSTCSNLRFPVEQQYHFFFPHFQSVRFFPIENSDAHRLFIFEYNWIKVMHAKKFGTIKKWWSKIYQNFQALNIFPSSYEKVYDAWIDWIWQLRCETWLANNPFLHYQLFFQKIWSRWMYRPILATNINVFCTRGNKAADKAEIKWNTRPRIYWKKCLFRFIRCIDTINLMRSLNIRIFYLLTAVFWSLINRTVDGRMSHYFAVWGSFYNTCKVRIISELCHWSNLIFNGWTTHQIRVWWILIPLNILWTGKCKEISG